jgi:hypothetical protein
MTHQAIASKDKNVAKDDMELWQHNLQPMKATEASLCPE